MLALVAVLVCAQATPSPPDTRWLERPNDPEVVAWAEGRTAAFQAWLDPGIVARAEAWLRREIEEEIDGTYVLVAVRGGVRLWRSWHALDPDADPHGVRFLQELHVQQDGEALPGRTLVHPTRDGRGPLCAGALSPDGLRVWWGRRAPEGDADAARSARPPHVRPATGAARDGPGAGPAPRGSGRPSSCEVVMADLARGTQAAWGAVAEPAITFGGLGHEDTLILAARRGAAWARTCAGTTWTGLRGR